MSPRRPNNFDIDNYEDLFTADEEERQKSPQERVRQMATPWRVGIVGGAILVLFLIFGVSRQFDPAGSPKDEVVVQIPRGTTTTGIAELLAKNKVVPSQTAFRAWIRLKSEGQFQAGEYTFHLNSSAGQALAVLNSGPDMQKDEIVIPEGSRLGQVAEIVGRLPGRSATKFIEVTRSGAVTSNFQPSGTTTLEGFLFPDTYFISPSDDELTLARRMVNRFDTVAREVGLDQAPRAVQHSPYDTLIIASMIESEAKIQADRGKISQVIENRLGKDMLLQIDATVLYAHGNDRQALSLNDLKINSPYNTYAKKGLPPGPISSPGRASLQAALAPEPGTWLYYVVTEANGGHSFATTEAEYEANLKIARQRGYIQ